MKNRKLHVRKFDYSWVIIGLCFLMVFTSLGFCSGGRSLYLTAITGALGIPRGAFSLNNTFRFITTTIVNLFFGKLVYRFGTKKLICAGFVCLIAFALMNASATSLPTFYIAGILLGVGLSWTGTTMVSTIINRWCKKNKATFTGAVLAANGVGSAVAVQILSPIIFMEGNPFGYRISYQLVALLLAIALLLILFLYREPPKTSEEAATTVGKKKKIRGTGWVGMEYKDAIRKPYLYVALACMFLTGMVLQGLSGIAAPHMYDIGLDVEYVAVLVSLSGILLSFSKFLTGYLYDRFGMWISMNICLVSAFISMAILSVLTNTPTGRVLAFIRTIFGALALPLETVMLPIFATEFFGNKPFEKLVGIFVSVSAAGFAVGSPFGNVCYDIFGDYKIAFMIFAILMLFVAVALQFALAAANRDRKKILAAQSAALPEEKEEN